MKSRVILVSKATPGMIVARDILDYNGNILVARDTPLTDKIISRLQFYSILTLRVRVNDNGTIPAVSMDKTNYEPTITESHLYKITTTKEYKQFRKEFFEQVEFFQNYSNDIFVNNKPIDQNQLITNMNNLLGGSRNILHLFDMLTCMKDYDDSTYTHCMNVAIISNVFGKWLNFSTNDANILTLCGLFHDIGKIEIPQSIIMKPCKLTDDEYNTVKKHTLIGYELLKNKNIDQRIKNSTIMHHERIDGSGYPNHLVGSQIDTFSRLIAIADVYDALTSRRIYRDPLCPFEVLNLFENEEYTRYDFSYVSIFFEKMFQTYIMNPIRLNDGSEGKVIMINKNSLGKPIVQVGTKFIDLSKEDSLCIQAIL